jgi:segregation and condensation protein B
MAKSKRNHHNEISDEQVESNSGGSSLTPELESALSAAAGEFSEFESLFEEERPESFLPEAEESVLEDIPVENEEVVSVEGSELDAFESAEIEEVEFVEDERLDSIIESILFASDRPVSLASIKAVFKGTNVKTDKLRKALDRFAVELAGSQRGVTLEEVNGGYQLRTKVDNLEFLKRTLKARSFKLSGPALEVLSIVAYKQPVVKAEIDEIRGVESGHLLRALMEKNLVTFEGKSELPGKPMQYGTTKKFLEIFGLRNLKELPTLSQIDELLPEGMSEDEVQKPKLSDITGELSQSVGMSYSEGEEELTKITDQLQEIDTSSEFFEQEKQRQREKRDAEKAQNIRDAIMMGEEVSNRDRNWLARYDEAQLHGSAAEFSKQEIAAEVKEEKQAEAQMEAESELFAEAESSTHELEAFDIEDDRSVET